MGIIPKVVIAAIFTFMAVLECSGVQIKIMSYNIQYFGKVDKLVRGGQMTTLGKNFVKGIYKYDVIFIQEVQSGNEDFLTALEDRLNDYLSLMKEKKRFTLAWPGCFFDQTGNYETYAYFINSEIKWDAALYPSRTFVETKSGSRTCDDFKGVGHQYFVRPPYSLCVKNYQDKCAFFLLGIHAKPDSAGKQTIKELNGLVHTYEYFRSKYGTPNAHIMGDLNADGKYVYSAEFELLDLTRRLGGKWIPFTNIPYTNVIGDTGRRAMYDRFYVTTHVMFNAAMDVKVVNEKALHQISNHYPITITINTGNN